MHQFASGSTAAVSLLGGGDTSGPPVGPDTIGRPPSNYEAPPVPLRPFPTSVLSAVATEPEAVTEQEIEIETEDVPSMAEVRRLVVRLLGGDEIELGSFDDRGDAMEAAQQLMGRFSSAEAAGEWPEVDGRFLRPGAVASIDVLVAD
jgi:hypothetical protein